MKPQTRGLPQTPPQGTVQPLGAGTITGHGPMTAGDVHEGTAMPAEGGASPPPTPAPFPTGFGSISFYDGPIGQVVEVAIDSVSLAPGNPPSLKFHGPLFTSTAILLTPANLRLLWKILESGGNSLGEGKGRREKGIPPVKGKVL